MNTRVLIAASLLLFLGSCSDSAKKKETVFNLSEADQNEITNTLYKTQDAWNTGDLEGFMAGYWKSEKLVFTGVQGPTYGYNETLERYKKGYPNSEIMGMLKFTIKDLYQIDNKTALMIGRFYLSRSMEDLEGYFTLVWQKIDDKWLIISDHSSGQFVRE